MPVQVRPSAPAFLALAWEPSAMLFAAMASQIALALAAVRRAALKALDEDEADAAGERAGGDRGRAEAQ